MENLFKQDMARLKLFKKYGYDMPRARNYILAKAGLAKGKILEIGTGRGHMAVALAKKGFKLISIDLDAKAQKIAKCSLKAMKLDKLVTLKVMNAEKLKYKDESFDNVISVNFIHHANRPARCIREMIRVARRKLIIADLNKQGNRIMDVIHMFEGRKHEQSKIAMLEIKNMLEKSGFAVKTYKGNCQTIYVASQGGAK